MSDACVTLDATDQYCTLLCVRADGVAPVVDLIEATDMARVRRRAEALLREHASCDHVEVWQDGSLVETLTRH